MAATILEALQNARINLVTNAGNPVAALFGKQQLVNAVTLLEKGYEPHDLVEPLLDQYGNADAVPDKPQRT